MLEAYLLTSSRVAIWFGFRSLSQAAAADLFELESEYDIKSTSSSRFTMSNGRGRRKLFTPALVLAPPTNSPEQYRQKGIQKCLSGKCHHWLDCERPREKGHYMPAQVWGKRKRWVVETYPFVAMSSQYLLFMFHARHCLQTL